MTTTKKPSLDVDATLDEIDAIITTFDGIAPYKLTPIYKLIGGKLYELYALSRLLAELVGRGWSPFFTGNMVELKKSPGPIDPDRPYFALSWQGGPIEFEVHTDIEVMTLGSALAPVSDFSAYHEIDLVVVEAGTTGRPSPDQLALGVECKATAAFSKAFVREVLGRRRELSYLNGPFTARLELHRNADDAVSVFAYPPSEYWLVYIDSAGDNYVQSPAVFSVELKHWKP